MGNHCCQDQNVSFSAVQYLEKNSPRFFANQYYEAQLPNDEEYRQKFEHINSNPDFTPLFQTGKILKHKFLDKYFLGKLNQKGCPQGLGVLYQPESLIYYGQFNNLPEGKGTLQLLKQELIYDGMFKQGKAEGIGKITSIDKRIQFTGIMENSYPKSGIIAINHQGDTNKSCKIQIQNFLDAPAKLLFGDGRIYEGLINKKSFAPEGKGVAYFNNNSHYEGEFEEGQMHGKGSFYWPDGSSYHGQYQHGKKHGHGTFNYSSRKFYQGEWVNGQQHGEGTLYEIGGKVIKSGIWNQGKFQRQS